MIILSTKIAWDAYFFAIRNRDKSLYILHWGNFPEKFGVFLSYIKYSNGLCKTKYSKKRIMYLK